MPRIPRAQQAELVYHVINRGNGRATILHKDQDYQTFLSLMKEKGADVQSRLKAIVASD